MSLTRLSNETQPAAPQLGADAELALRVALPRLAGRADEVARAIEAFDATHRVDFSRRMASIPGAEALSVLARIPEASRERVLAHLGAKGRQRKRLAEVLHRIGNAQDDRSVASALSGMVSDSELRVGEVAPSSARPASETPPPSLEASLRGLSDRARATIPALSLLVGGCLENMAPVVAGLDEKAWSAVRGELEHTGLVRVQGPVLFPHPALAGVRGLAPTDEVSTRFIRAVVSLCLQFNKAVRSADAKVALSALGSCERVVRRAIAYAMEAGDLDSAWFMADCLGKQLQWVGRASDRAALTAEMHRRAGPANAGEVDPARADLAREAAHAGASTDPGGAVEKLNGLLAALETVTGWDTRYQRATTMATLARVRTEQGMPPTETIRLLQGAEATFAQLEREGQIDTVNRGAVLGDLANAQRDLGAYPEALDTAQRGLALACGRGDLSGEARALGRIAEILKLQGRLRDARDRYGEALRAAEQAGDDEAIGVTSQHLGSLAGLSGDPQEAARHIEAALRAFQRAGNKRGEMQAFASLGVADAMRGNYDAALAWYARSMSIAEEIRDIHGQAAVRSSRANALWNQAEQAGDPEESRRLRDEAIAEDRRALGLKEQLAQPRSLAITLSNLARRLCAVGQLDEAQSRAEGAVTIFEKTHDPEAWKTLDTLERIAEARGDADAAAEYRRRREAAFREAQQRAGTPFFPMDRVTALLKMALTARVRGDTLTQAAAASGAPDGALAAIEERDPWLLAHLRALAEHQPRPEVEVPKFFAGLLDQAWAAVEGRTA
jgi:tetratricopeptide (TPR) repeat protein